MGLDSLDVVDILMAFEDEFGKIYHEGTDTIHYFSSPPLLVALLKHLSMH